MEIEMELSRIIINEASDQQLIVLKEKDGERTLPIVIGIVEIFAIDRRLKGLDPPRPMTHDLLERVIQKLGAELEKVIITNLKDHTFYAILRLTMDGKTINIDARPSDSIALAVATKSPIFAHEQVLDQAAQ